jgi:NAD(P)-dependent dehydrogenase (short-subunit alcohol dehydrogenase family)
VGQCNYGADYGAAKAGIAQMTRALALDWARFNINVNLKELTLFNMKRLSILRVHLEIRLFRNFT